MELLHLKIILMHYDWKTARALPYHDVRNHYYASSHLNDGFGRTLLFGTAACTLILS
jgi:hypothetical protein